MSPANGKSTTDPDNFGRALKRLCLLDSLIEARRSADRSQADEVLVEANRWLRLYPLDVRVMEARDRLRALHPVDSEDTEEVNDT